MRKILVPFDFSAQSIEAFKVALQLAPKSKAQIILLHLLAMSPVYSGAGEPLAFDPITYASLEDEAKKKLNKMKTGASKSIKVHTEVISGDLLSSVKSLTESRKVDLVVMGTSGASGFSEIFIGSNTEKVVRFSTVPVLAIRKSFSLKSIKNILVPSTLQLNQTRFIKELNRLQEFFDAKLHILLVNTPIHFRTDAEANEALQEFVQHYKLKNYKTHFCNYTREEDGIVDFAYSEGMDLIVMATHARKGLAHLFNISITENVVNHIQSPIWTFCLES
ncbi:MAG: universal stress protein UspA [Marivirga sp.]|nr:universal stress protein UspA [Marivirga sp.]